MGFSITSTVERVLAITELVDLICELSPRYGTTDWSIYSSYDNSSPGLSTYGALPVLARTTKFLSKRALRVLWRRLDSFWPLLRLLPGDLLDSGDSPSYLGEQDGHDYAVCPFPLITTRCLLLTQTRQALRTPQLEDFVRYTYYAKFVQYISCAQEEVLPQHTFDILVTRTAPVFPRLRRLQFFVPLGTTHRSQYHHFLHPSLRELILHDNGPVNATMDLFLSMVEQRCTKLRALQVVPYWFPRSDYDIHAALGKCLTSLAHLTILSISVTCRSMGRALSLLESRLQRLVHLTLFLVDGTPSDAIYFPPNRVLLPNLTSLSFVAPFPDIILMPFLPPPNLEVLHIRSQTSMHEDVWAATSEAVADFAKDLVGLKEVLVFDYHPFNDDPGQGNTFTPEVSEVGLGSLLKRNFLKSVCITTTIYISPTPALLQSVIDAWKDHLELFVLSPIAYLINGPVPPATLQDVIKFAFKCPKLVRVGMLFNAKRPRPAIASTTTTSTTVVKKENENEEEEGEGEGEGEEIEEEEEEEFYDVPTAPHVRELMAGAAWIDDIDYVVRLLKHGFPCLRRIDWADSETYLAMPEDRAKKWEVVEKKLGLGP